MNKRKIILYVIAVIILFLFPAYAVFQNYDLLINGEEYLFEVEAFDPYDMFRGKYLYINFKENEVKSERMETENEGHNNYYVEIKRNKDGFAYFDNVTYKKPKNIKNYYKTTGYYYKYSKSHRISTPTKYFMNEKKSVNAEKVYEDNLENAYVKVRVKNGRMVVVGVYVNDILIDSYK